MSLNVLPSRRHHLINDASQHRILTWNFWEKEIEGNTGFYFVRSTPQTLKLWAKTIEAIPM